MLPLCMCSQQSELAVSETCLTVSGKVCGATAVSDCTDTAAILMAADKPDCNSALSDIEAGGNGVSVAIKEPSDFLSEKAHACRRRGSWADVMGSCF